MPKKRIKSAKTTFNISFRLSQDHFAILENHGKSLRDDAGLPLSPSQAARRIVAEMINQGLILKDKVSK